MLYRIPHILGCYKVRTEINDLIRDLIIIEPSNPTVEKYHRLVHHVGKLQRHRRVGPVQQRF
jgi:hypothetical protein